MMLKIIEGEYMRVLCFDIGGTNVKYGVIDNEKFLEKGLFDTNADLGKEHLTNILVDMARKMKDTYQIDGIGISCAGSVNFEKHILKLHQMLYLVFRLGF